jgi:hypothetical protein
MKQQLKRHAFRSVVIGLCQYEVAAILSGKVPTLTSLSKEHRWLPWVIVGGLSVHLYRSR